MTLIDTGAPGSEKRVIRSIRRIGKKPEDLELILVTHAHADHIGSAARLRSLTGAKVFIHADDERVANGSRTPYGFVRHGVTGVLFGPLEGTLARFNTFPPVQVDGFLTHGQVIEPGIRIVATPGHTPGHVSVALLEGRLLHVGDALFNLAGVRPPWLVATQDELGTYQSIARLAEESFVRMTFGHGPPALRGAQKRIDRLARRLSLRSTS